MGSWYGGRLGHPTGACLVVGDLVVGDLVVGDEEMIWRGASRMPHIPGAERRHPARFRYAGAHLSRHARGRPGAAGVIQTLRVSLRANLAAMIPFPHTKPHGGL